MLPRKRRERMQEDKLGHIHTEKQVSDRMNKQEEDNEKAEHRLIQFGIILILCFVVAILYLWLGGSQ